MQLRIWRKAFFLVTFCFLVLFPFQALADPALDCDSPMYVVQGVGGVHEVSAVAGATGNIVAFDIFSVVPSEPGITFGNISPGLDMAQSVTGDVTVDSSVAVGTYTVTIEATDVG